MRNFLLVSLFASLPVFGQLGPLTGGFEGSSLNRQAVEQVKAGRTSTKDTTRNVVVFAGDRVIPQLVDGAGWQTSMTFVNLENRVVRFSVYFFADNGTDLYIPIVGLGTVRGMIGVFNVAQSETVETVGASTKLSQGWAYIVTENIADAVGGLAVFKQMVPGIPDFEAVVPVVNEFDGHFVLMFDNTKFVTAMAIANPRPIAVIVPLNIRNEGGAIIESTTMTLAPYEHRAFVIPDEYKITAGRRGKIEFLAPGFGVAALGLRFNPSGAFTSFHVLSNFNWR